MHVNVMATGWRQARSNRKLRVQQLRASSRSCLV
jgi:hypothetical protein